MHLKEGEGKVKSVVPITGRGIVKYLQKEFFSQNNGNGDKPTVEDILAHEKSITLHIGKTIPVGGYAAHFEAFSAIEKWDGDVIMVNPTGHVKPDVVEIF